jgi:hypothetical protein
MHENSVNLRKLPVVWITLSTALITLIVNLPLIYGAFGVHGGYIWKLWGYSPQQFVFLLAPLPIATFATLIALTIIFATLTNSPNAHGMLQWSGRNWVVIILIGFILSTLFAIFDYYGNPKVFDRLKPEYAERAVVAADEVREKLLVLSAADAKNMQRQAEIRTAALRTQGDMSRQNLLNLDPSVYLRVATDAEFQRKFQMLQPVSHLLSQLQLTFALFVGFGTLFAATLVFISYFSQGVDLSKAIPAVITALAFFALYPLCFSYWSAEINFLTGRPINNVGYLIAGGLILIVGVLLAVVDANVRGVTSNIGTALPAILSLFALFATRAVGVENLGMLIGVDANSATRFFVLVALFLIGIMLSAMLIVQYEDSFRRGVEP